MAIRQLRLPIFNDTYYSYSVSLEGNKYSLEFLFLERVKGWVVTLKNSNGETLVRNQKLTPETPLFIDYKLPDLSGAFYFKPVSQSVYKSETNNLIKPKGFYELFYVFDDGE